MQYVWLFFYELRCTFRVSLGFYNSIMDIVTAYNAEIEHQAPTPGIDDILHENSDEEIIRVTNELTKRAINLFDQGLISEKTLEQIIELNNRVPEHLERIRNEKK